MLTNEHLTKLGIDNKWLQPLLDTFDKYEINTPQRLAAWFGETKVESANYTAIKENLNYRPETLVKLFKEKFSLSISIKCG